jgi:D-serine dehydratase
VEATSGTAGLEAFPPDVLDQIKSGQPLLWLNPRLGGVLPETGFTPADIIGAETRLARSTELMSLLFPELSRRGGVIESPLVRVVKLQHAMASDPELDGQWLIKADHALPIAGSVKARGAFHEVLSVAEAIAIEHGLLGEDDTIGRLASAPLRAVFEQHTITVGSTGNLGLAVGIMAAALGFKTIIHMSTGAKAWKKDRLRQHGVTVIEHAGDYAHAVAAGRAESAADWRSHFVDDEGSAKLFLGYAAAARHLAGQLLAAERNVDRDHPLFVYIPCGVGGAPGGITYGLKALFGDHVHCFFAEPVASPCMLVQLASGQNLPLAVQAFGLNNRTEADGLAVGQASHLASSLMAMQLSGVFTATDQEMFSHLAMIYQTEAVELEPSAAAGIGGPNWMTRSVAGLDYVHRHGLNLRAATHVIWTTGGSLVPAEAHNHFRTRAQQ